MSRGPGKWQRMILEALEDRDFVIVCDLLPKDAKRAEQSALNRATHKLADAGKVEISFRSRLTTTSHPNSCSGKCHPNTNVVTLPGVKGPVQDYHSGEWETWEEHQRKAKEDAKKMMEMFAKRGTR